jgi:biopolymer transport protein ExbD
MQFRPQQQPDFAIDMTPMIDCVFQLLIFFLLSSSFVTPAVQLELPRSDAEQPKAHAQVVVTLDAAGALFLNKEAVDRDRLHTSLKGLLRDDSKKPVTVRADKRLEYQKVLETILLVQQAGATRVRLAYEETGP